MSTQKLGGVSILVVEDEGAQALDLQLSLEEAGASVVGPVGFVEDALDIMENLPELDCAILDLNLHGELVFPVADILLEHDVPVIFATAYEAENLPTRYRGLPMFLKPLFMDQITRAIEHEISRTNVHQ
jgi:CheY-like chemotaxis protein